MDDTRDYTLARLRDCARRAKRSWSAVTTDFLDPLSWQLAGQAAQEEGADLALWGGYPEAERRVAGFRAQDDGTDLEWPILPLTLTWDTRYGRLGHRDLLGALLGLGIQRAGLGDILLEEGRAVAFVHSSVADLIQLELKRAGRATIRVEKTSTNKVQLPHEEWVNLSATVATPRLDAILASGFHLSRSEAQRVVKSGLVRVNFAEETRTDRKVEAGDLISLRGAGRLRMLTLGDATRKGRYHIELERTQR